MKIFKVLLSDSDYDDFTSAVMVAKDEASILEYFGEHVYIVKGNNLNDKLTTPEDFEIFANRAH